jgi:hypothetical protein
MGWRWRLIRHHDRAVRTLTIDRVLANKGDERHAIGCRD